MKSVLFVQFRTTPLRIAVEQARHRRALPPDVSLTFCSIFDFTDAAALLHKARAYDALMFGGSGDFDIDGGRAPGDFGRTQTPHILELIQDTVQDVLHEDKHFFGICFGHQLVAELLGGKVTHDHRQQKFGTHTVLKLPDGDTDALFGTFPEVFYAQYWHKDSVTTLPQGAVTLAASPTCNFAALRYRQNVYTTQFHPEIAATDIEGIPRRKTSYLAEPPAAIDMHESPEAASLLSAFYARLKNSR
ncbi:hypothetical protein A3C89_01415 [Candidatus Kaiserbacteria bacterium RIFCSPHIGHO2_02_FULL_50_50]|uniref:Glutamine amidotransferase domain-containing protein n=1 Tax=Candidatus Kaiserbacteria bacterium RIFCSPHIGHO2_02_FULL_50_50 TaxID=1798492 RepID=A0A1F6DC99_9BACT|nr:MAG: hypothetical protein A3C89_01415 [Candidatus Kaiserbacteria bacterium RIFCSPHIGHO2_02_FULL_50_50]OGG89301.1 MAG: hypothetical protein A3G62_01490 [Candidatus Kaiserbacteria bacterium RIFCSPLOWO2_12_FULL_50_10]